MAEIPLSFWIKLAVSFKYISNFAIIVGILAYYMNAMTVFFICAPLMIVNCILITFIEIFQLDTLIKGIFNKYSITPEEQTETKVKYVVWSTIWHFGSVLWLYTILHNGLILVYNPNFMGIFLQSIIVPLIYFIALSKSQVYGKNLNYIGYLFMYVILLFATCIKLYYK